MQDQDDFILGEHLFVIGPNRQVRIDQGNDGLQPEFRVSANDPQQVFFLSIIQRLKHAIVIDEARKSVVNVRTQHCHIEGNAQQLALCMAEVSAGGVA